MLRAWAAARAQVKASQGARKARAVSTGGLLACAAAFLGLLFLGSRGESGDPGD